MIQIFLLQNDVIKLFLLSVNSKYYTWTSICLYQIDSEKKGKSQHISLKIYLDLFSWLCFFLNSMF